MPETIETVFKEVTADLGIPDKYSEHHVKMIIERVIKKTSNYDITRILETEMWILSACVEGAATKAEGEVGNGLLNQFWKVQELVNKIH